MFERYTERSRRVIFWGLVEASRFGSRIIETEHLLLGLIREDNNLLRRFHDPDPTESIVAELHTQLGEGREIPSVPEGKIFKPAAAIDLPLSDECLRIFTYAAADAQQLNHRYIGCEHLLTGMLRESGSRAALILQRFGLQREQILQQLKEASTT